MFSRCVTVMAWTPYTALVFIVWGALLDISRGRWQGEAIFGAFVVTVLMPYVYTEWGRRGIATLRKRMRPRGRADTCPTCGYALHEEGEQLCPECGVVSTLAERLRVPRDYSAQDHRRWLKRFAIAIVVGLLSGWLLGAAESVIAHRYARDAFTRTVVGAPLTLTPIHDHDPPWISGFNRYANVTGGRLFYDHASAAPDARLLRRTFRLEPRITPWWFLGPKYVDESGRVFVSFD